MENLLLIRDAKMENLWMVMRLCVKVDPWLIHAHLHTRNVKMENLFMVVHP